MSQVVSDDLSCVQQTPNNGLHAEVEVLSDATWELGNMGEFLSPVYMFSLCVRWLISSHGPNRRVFRSTGGSKSPLSVSVNGFPDEMDVSSWSVSYMIWATFKLRAAATHTLLQLCLTRSSRGCIHSWLMGRVSLQSTSCHLSNLYVHDRITNLRITKLLW